MGNNQKSILTREAFYNAVKQMQAQSVPVPTIQYVDDYGTGNWRVVSIKVCSIPKSYNPPDFLKSSIRNR